jgi:hypothetical protein
MLCTHLSRLKKVDLGEFWNGFSTLLTRDQSSVFQILTVLSSDWYQLSSHTIPQRRVPEWPGIGRPGPSKLP